VAVPVLVSSRGYGLLWDNPAVTDVDVGSDGKQTASTDREDDRSKAGSTAMTRQEGPAGPSSFEGNGQVGSTPKAASSTLTFSSESAESIDYYFMYGPEPDQIISSYRKLTGEAPMFGRWAFGFWQCKERYKSEQELMDVVGEYRNRNIPIDGIIQDWRYWTPALWGSHEFDPKRYPDPVKMIRDLHAENTHILISVWPKFDPKSDNAAELRRVNGLYPQIITYMGDGQWVDTFNPEARRVYWQQISRKLFSKGIDGFWLDGSEPELNAKTGEYRDFTTAAGPGFKVNNAYPLMLTRAVYEGQRSETSEKRVFILTRSAYAGQQRYGAVTWSGDIKGTWDVFAKQIPAGVNFSLSGIPYWNTDTGGFDTDEGPKSPAYRELFTRWFEFSAFCPMFRVHGTGDPKEIWRFDDATQKILVSYDELRYHLMPYIYSTSWKVTHEGYTMMRGLVMDFRGDPKVYDITDQYLFGPGIMVSPVVKAGAATREVYLPGGTKWIDFWSGKTFEGGQTIEAQVPIETEPLLVRAGSIIPYGPPIQYAAEKSDPIELRVYRGASGNFTLYEDEGDSYDYEKGVYSTIPISWNEATHKLTIGARKGSFPGMQANRTFRIVWVRPNHGTGIPNTETSDAVVNYNGKAVTISARE
jgi:alpha-D-xyloside xylohydrolase